jgi:hypothetical protein
MAAAVQISDFTGLPWFPSTALSVADLAVARRPLPLEANKRSGAGSRNVKETVGSGSEVIALPAGMGSVFTRVSDYDPMPAELRAKLAAFYGPFNQAFYLLLGRDLGWEDQMD